MSSKDAKFALQGSPFNSNQFQFISDHENFMQYMYHLCHSPCHMIGTWQSEVVLLFSWMAWYTVKPQIKGNSSCSPLVVNSPFSSLVVNRKFNLTGRTVRMDQLLLCAAATVDHAVRRAPSSQAQFT